MFQVSWTMNRPALPQMFPAGGGVIGWPDSCEARLERLFAVKFAAPLPLLIRSPTSMMSPGPNVSPRPFGFPCWSVTVTFWNATILPVESTTSSGSGEPWRYVVASQ